MLHAYVDVDNTHELLGRSLALAANHPVFGRSA